MNAIKLLQAAFPECAIVRGWHLAGAGPARFGWAAKHPSGAVRYLGRSLRDATGVVFDAINAINAVQVKP